MYHPSPAGASPFLYFQHILDDRKTNKAKELVLAQLGLQGASFNNHEYEPDDGVYEFAADGVEYDYIDAYRSIPR